MSSQRTTAQVQDSNGSESSTRQQHRRPSFGVQLMTPPRRSQPSIEPIGDTRSDFEVGGQGHEQGVPVGVFWDIENQPVPRGVDGESISEALRDTASRFGSISQMNAFGDLALRMNKDLRSSLQECGVNLLDVPTGRKEAADKAILVDMLLFAVDHRPPAVIVMISNDKDYSNALHRLRQRRYTVVLIVRPCGFINEEVPKALFNAATQVMKWDLEGLMGDSQGQRSEAEGKTPLSPSGGKNKKPVPRPVSVTAVMLSRSSPLSPTRFRDILLAVLAQPGSPNNNNNNNNNNSNNHNHKHSNKKSSSSSTSGSPGGVLLSQLPQRFKQVTGCDLRESP